MIKTLIIFLIFSLYSSIVCSEDLKLDCRGIEGNFSKEVGYLGSTKHTHTQDKPKNVIVTISDLSCQFDWGTFKSNFKLLNSSNDKIFCNTFKDESHFQDYEKRVTKWEITINRLNGKMIYLYDWDVLSKEKFVTRHLSKSTFQCSKAKNIF